MTAQPETVVPSAHEYDDPPVVSPSEADPMALSRTAHPTA